MIRENWVSKIFDNESILKRLMLYAFFAVLSLSCITCLFYLSYQASSIFYFSLALFLIALFIFLFLLTYLDPVSSLILCLIATFNPYYVYITITSYWDGQYTRAVAEIVFLILFAFVFILKSVFGEKITRIKTPLDAPLIIFSIFLIFGTLYGFWQGYPWKIILADLEPMGEFIAFFFLTTLVVKNENQTKKVIIATLTWLILVGIGELIFYFAPWWSGGYLKFGYGHLGYSRTLGGMFLDRLNDFMSLISMCLLAALYLCPASVKNRTKNKLILISFVPLIVLFLGFFRSLWLGTIGAFVFILLMVGKYKKTIKTLILCLIILGTILLITDCVLAKTLLGGRSIILMFFEGIMRLNPFVIKTMGVENYSEYSRLYQFNEFFQVIYKHPLIGTGFGPDTAAADYYLEIIYKMGIIAIFFFIWPFYIFFKRGISIFKSTEFGFNKGLRLGILASFVAVGIILFVYPGIGHFPLMVYLGVMVASFFSLNNKPIV
jgi:hypothetical protein